MYWLSILFFAELKKLFPSLVNFLLELLDKMLVAFFEKMLKSSLMLKKFLNRKLVFRLVVKNPFAVYYLKKRPVACFNA